jgi:hypothetical protein
MPLVFAQFWSVIGVIYEEIESLLLIHSINDYKATSYTPPVLQMYPIASSNSGVIIINAKVG